MKHRVECEAENGRVTYIAMALMGPFRVRAAISHALRGTFHKQDPGISIAVPWDFTASSEFQYMI